MAGRQGGATEALCAPCVQLYKPGDDRHKIEKAARLGVDCICLVLEDTAAINRKAEARRMIATALGGLDFGPAEKLVRVNPVGSGLEAVLPDWLRNIGIYQLVWLLSTRTLC